MMPCFAVAQEQKIERLKVPIVIGTEEVILPRGIRFAPQLVQKDGTVIEEAEWSAKENDTLAVFASDNMYSLSPGSVTLMAKANGKTYKFKVTIPKVYATQSKITIETPDPVLIGTQINVSGIFTTSYQGKAAKIQSYDLTGEEELDPIVKAAARDIEFSMITPVKAGTSKIIIKSGSKTLKTITITVKESAVK